MVPLGMLLRFALGQVVSLVKHQRVGLLDVGFQQRLVLDV